MKKWCFHWCGPFLAIAGFAAVSAGVAEANTVDTLALIAQSGGQYDYAIQLAPNHGLVFAAGDQIVLSGLSGVTAASVLPSLNICFSTSAVTAASVTFAASAGCPVIDPTSTGSSIGDLRVFSSVLTTGLVNYQVQTGNEGTLSGTVAGPVAIPEPATGALMTAGIYALLAISRRRRRRR